MKREERNGGTEQTRSGQGQRLDQSEQEEGRTRCRAEFNEAAASVLEAVARVIKRVESILDGREEGGRGGGWRVRGKSIEGEEGV